MDESFQCVLNQEDLNEITGLSNYEFFFLFDGKGELNLQWLNEHDYALEHLIYDVSKTPDKLIVHIQRIYHCYQSKLSEQLYAALIDFFIVLDGRGLLLSQRMLKGCKSVLAEQQINFLQDYLTTKPSSPYFLSHQFSVLGKGLIGRLNLINKTVELEPQQYDPLMIARDYIEYSQLDEAKEVLELAVKEQPKRSDLQLELLDIYRSTRDVLGFQEMYETVIDEKTSDRQAWDDLKTYFAK